MIGLFEVRLGYLRWYPIMPRRKKTLREECEALLGKHAHLARRRKRHLGIYVASLVERFTAMDYSLRELYRFIGLQPQLSTDSFDPFADHKQKRDHYANCFWASAYSIFDILSHVINTLYPAVIDESKVSFAGAAHDYNLVPKDSRGKIAIPQRVKTKLVTTTNANYFKKLAAYRQCCLHRRAVCVFEESTTISPSQAYVESTSKYQPRVVTWICDDPDDMVPKYKKKRRLEDECDRIRDRIEEDVRQLIRML